MEITIKIKSVFGQERIYPVCPNALTLSDLCGKKTFDRIDLKNIEKLGFSIKVVNAYTLENSDANK
jgi:hypothetical protein